MDAASIKQYSDLIEEMQAKGDKGDKIKPFTFITQALAILAGSKSDKSNKGDKGDKKDSSDDKNFWSNLIASTKGPSDKKGSGDKKDKPREIVKKSTSVIIEDYSAPVRKFWDDLFKKYFHREEKKKEPESKSGGWLTMLLTILGGVILGAILFFKDKILPFLEAAWKIFKKGFGFVWRVIKGIGRFLKGLGKGNFIRRMINGVKAFFKGLKSRIFNTLKKSKLGRKILGVYYKVRRFFSGIGKSILKVFRRVKSGKIGGMFAKLFSGISKVFRAVIGGVRAGVGIGVKVFKGIGSAIGFLFKMFGKVGGIISKLLPGIKILGKIIGKLFLPLTILMAAFDIFGEIFQSIKDEGLSFTSVLKGLAGGLLKFFTFGFFDLGTINKAVDSLSDFFVKIMAWFKDIPRMVTNLIRKIPGAKYLLGDEEKSQAEINVGIDAKNAALTASFNARQAAKAPSTAASENPGTVVVNPPVNDFISRPDGVTGIDSQDTLIGFKKDGPLDGLFGKSIKLQEDTVSSLESLVNMHQAQIEWLSRIAENITRIQPNVMVNNNNNSKVNLNPGSMSSNFRNTVAA